MDNIQISAAELNDPRIDEVISVEKARSQTAGQFVEDVKTPFYLNPICYYSIACLLVAFGVWGACEPLIDDEAMHGGFLVGTLRTYLFFGAVAGGLGLALGAVYGLANHNGRDFLYCSGVGIGVGLLATIATTFIAGVFFSIAGVLTHIAAGDRWADMRDNGLTGAPFFILMSGRALAWAIVSAGAALGLGVALKSKKLLLNGLAGGLVGGALGGMLFDPISRWVTGWNAPGNLSRAVGVSSIGLLVGLFIGIFENISKDAWFLMLKGPLTGKQFNIFKSPMTIGSAPKCNIYLFKDPGIDPHHASVVKSGNRYMLEDQHSQGGTFVNGRRADKYVLRPNDIVTIGQTVLKYHEKQAR